MSRTFCFWRPRFMSINFDFGPALLYFWRRLIGSGIVVMIRNSGDVVVSGRDRHRSAQVGPRHKCRSLVDINSGGQATSKVCTAFKLQHQSAVPALPSKQLAPRQGGVGSIFAAPRRSCPERFSPRGKTREDEEKSCSTGTLPQALRPVHNSYA